MMPFLCRRHALAALLTLIFCGAAVSGVARAAEALVFAAASLKEALDDAARRYVPRLRPAARPFVR